MAEITIIPLLNAQQLSMSGLAHHAAVRPEAAQAIAGELALALLRQEAQEVQRTEPGSLSDMVSDREGGGGGFAQPHQHRKEPREEEQNPSPKPLVGNLLNVKV